MKECICSAHIWAMSISCIVTAFFIPLIIAAAKRYQILDVPDGKIKCHQAPVPYMGGVAVICGFLISFLIVAPISTLNMWFLAGMLFLFITGMIDDLKVLKPWQKLLGQFCSVILFLQGGLELKTTFLSSWLNVGLSAFWMLSIINAFNLVDVMDGLASSIAFWSSLFFLWLAFIQGNMDVALLLCAFLGALIAFFLFNKPSAKIYLGDAGSLLLGGFLATIPFFFSWSMMNGEMHYVPGIILAVPLLEVFALVVIRSWIGIPFYYGSPHHFSLFLQRKGWTRWGILLFSSIMCIAFGLCALLHILGCMSFMTLFFSVILLCGLWGKLVFLP